jgi:multicomponent Na+:H+ antiporter subunit E
MNGIDGAAVVHAISLGVVLAIVWLLLSGHFEPLVLTLGLASCVVVVAITRRMDLVDHEGHPIHLTRRATGYWLWLAWEVVKANIDVAKRVLAPNMNISPTMVRLTASQKTDLGLVIYANSITLTPGTVSVDVDPGEILVHALSRDAADDLKGGEMDRRVAQVEGEG